MLFDGIGMDAIVRPGEGAACFPADGKALAFLFLEPLIILDNI